MPCRDSTIGWGRDSALILAGEEAAREREIWELTESEALASGEHISFSASFDEVVVVLSADESNGTGCSGDPVGVGNLPS
jgi:hypothetical protein